MIIERKFERRWRNILLKKMRNVVSSYQMHSMAKGRGLLAYWKAGIFALLERVRRRFLDNEVLQCFFFGTFPCCSRLDRHKPALDFRKLNIFNCFVTKPVTTRGSKYFIEAQKLMYICEQEKRNQEN